MKIFYRITIICLFLIILSLIIAFARGYRIDLNRQSFTSTGIIAISAYPKASKIYINDQLKGVSDINITLPPGTYQVEVKKDGYTSWKKTVKLRGELVLTLDALLYPLNPSLSPLTSLSVSQAIALDQSEKLILFSENDDEVKDGIYLFETNRGPLSFFAPLKLIALKKSLSTTLGTFSLKETSVEVSPDAKEAVFTFQTLSGTVSYLLSLENDNISFFDISSSKDTLVEAWSGLKADLNRKILEAYPKDFAKVASDSFHVIEFSPDEAKLLYQAKQSITLPQTIKPPLIAVNQTPEERSIETDSLYVYDRKEDRNYLISNDQVLNSKQISNFKIQILNFISWYSDSKHLVINEGKKISFVDYDNQNKQTVYSGAFDSGFFKVTSDGKILVLTNLNPEANRLPDLYAVGIR